MHIFLEMASHFPAYAHKICVAQLRAPFRIAHSVFLIPRGPSASREGKNSSDEGYAVLLKFVDLSDAVDCVTLPTKQAIGTRIIREN